MAYNFFLFMENYIFDKLFCKKITKNKIFEKSLKKSYHFYNFLILLLYCIYRNCAQFICVKVKYCVNIYEWLFWQKKRSEKEWKYENIVEEIIFWKLRFWNYIFWEKFILMFRIELIEGNHNHQRLWSFI